jgi:toxin ParE1/3/4
VKRRVVRSEAAVEDALAIVDDLLVAVGLDTALATEERIDTAIESLDELSDRGRVVPELRARGITIYRELIVLPYRIVYRVETQEVWVVAVIDHRRDLDRMLYQRARRERGQ